MIRARTVASPRSDGGMRLDKWLWAARFFKTRSLATAAIDAGQVALDGARVKPARDIKAGDRLSVRTPSGDFGILVTALSERRGNAQAATLLYQETDESRTARAAEAERKKRFDEPAAQLFARPTKKDRRALDRLRDD